MARLGHRVEVRQVLEEPPSGHVLPRHPQGQQGEAPFGHGAQHQGPRGNPLRVDERRLQRVLRRRDEDQDEARREGERLGGEDQQSCHAVRLSEREAEILRRGEVEKKMLIELLVNSVVISDGGTIDVYFNYRENEPILKVPDSCSTTDLPWTTIRMY